MNLKRSGLWVFFANTLGSLLVFAGTIFFARFVGAGELGSYFLFEGVLSMLALGTDFGLRKSIEKRLSEAATPAILTTGIVVKLFPIGLAGLLIFVGVRPLNAYLRADLAQLLIPAVFLREYSRLTMNVLNAELRVSETAGLRILQRGTWAGVGTLGLLNGYGVESLVYSLLLGYTLTILVGIYRINTSLGRPTKTALSSLFDFAKFNAVTKTNVFFHGWLDTLVIGLFLGPVSVSAYEIAWRVSALVMMSSSAIATVAFPQVSEWSAKGELKRVANLTQKGIVPPLYFSVPALAGVALFSTEIMTLLFGQEYVIGGTALVVLVAGRNAQAIDLVKSRVIQALDRPELTAKVTIVSVGTNILLNFSLVLYFGINGAAFATASTFVVALIMHSRYLSELISYSWPLAELSGFILGSAVMGAVLYALRSISAVNGLPVLFGYILLGVLVYAAATLAYPPSRSSLLNFLRERQIGI